MVRQEDSALFLSHVKIPTMIVQTISARVIPDMQMIMDSASKVVCIILMKKQCLHFRRRKIIIIIIIIKVMKTVLR